MNINNICLGCMKEKPQPNMICPYCGYNFAPNEKHQLPVNIILNNTYLVGKCLGDGGFGITYIGYDMNLYKKVAIKEFYLKGYCNRGDNGFDVISEDEKKGVIFNREKARFVEEGRILAQIDEQPGVVKVMSYFEQNNTAYIVMEFLEGTSLKSYVKQQGGKLEVGEALGIIQPVVKALAGIHEKGVVHRDISPDNIMITNSGKVKLIDFGAAKTKEDDMSANKVYKKSYSPLEQQSREGVIGTYSDIYALCASIYEIITGVKVQNARERAEMDMVKSPSELGVNVTPIQDAAIMNGLAINIEDRIKNAADLYYFLFVYGNTENPSGTAMKKIIKESSTKVILEKMQKEKKTRKNKKATMLALIIITVLGCLIIMVRQLGDMKQGKEDSPVVITDDGGNYGETDDSSELTEEDLKKYREELYGLINKEREETHGEIIDISSKYEAAASDCAKACTELDISGGNMNQLLSDAMNTALRDNNLSNVGWVIVTYNTDFSIQQVYEDIKAQIASVNASITNPIDLSNCNGVGISLGVGKDGTYYWVVIYK